MSDIGILIAILAMVFANFLIEKETGIKSEVSFKSLLFISYFFLVSLFKKVDIPDTLTPTKAALRNNTWFVSPLGSLTYTPLPLWVPFAAALPAFLIFIVLFMEVELTG